MSENGKDQRQQQLLEQRRALPDAPGVYVFADADGRVLYVGKAKSLRQRLSNYFQNPAGLHPRTAQMVATAATVEWIQVRNDVEALMLEYSLIKQHRPRFNIRLRDDKSYPFLAITTGDDWPRAMVMRGKKRKGVTYFGPYGHAYAIPLTGSGTGVAVTGLHWLLVKPGGLSISSKDENVRKRTIDVMLALIDLCAALGGKYFFDDDQQFPDTQTCVYEWPGEGQVGQKRQLIFEQRIWSPYVQEGYENGNAFYGTKGMLILGKHAGYQLFGERNKLVEKGEGVVVDNGDHA